MLKQRPRSQHFRPEFLRRNVHATPKPSALDGVKSGCAQHATQDGGRKMAPGAVSLSLSHTAAEAQWERLWATPEGGASERPEAKSLQLTNFGLPLLQPEDGGGFGRCTWGWLALNSLWQKKKGGSLQENSERFGRAAGYLRAWCGAHMHAV